MPPLGSFGYKIIKSRLLAASNVPSRQDFYLTRFPILRQFSVGTVIALAIRKAAIMACDQFCGATYAQFGEDRQILHHLWECPSKFYVDIGCNHPDQLSNTYLLYQLGWHGLCVDANQSLLDKFKKLRPNDRVECACVGGEPGRATFVIAKNPAFSHVAGEELVHPAAGNEARRVLVPVKTLNQLFEEHSIPRQFGLLSIDVEGMDFVALRSFDLQKWRPYAILIEIHDLKLEDCANNEIVSYLRRAGYRLAGYNTFTAFFLAAGLPVCDDMETAAPEPRMAKI